MDYLTSMEYFMIRGSLMTLAGWVIKVFNLEKLRNVLCMLYKSTALLTLMVETFPDYFKFILRKSGIKRIF
jgi:hypothetical protein